MSDQKKKKSTSYQHNMNYGCTPKHTPKYPANHQIDGYCKPANKGETETVDAFTRSFPPRGDFQFFPVIDANVVLAEVLLEADVEAHIELPTPAKEIKSIRKNVYLTQAKVIPSVVRRDLVKVFITGVVHKNIQYVEEYSGYVRDYGVDIKFSTNQQVRIFNPVNTRTSQKSSVHENRFLDKKGHGADKDQFGSYHSEFFNEPIEVKLLGAIINELDLAKDHNLCGSFKKITEKMEVVIFLKLFQKQQYDPRCGFGADGFAADDFDAQPESQGQYEDGQDFDQPDLKGFGDSYEEDAKSGKGADSLRKSLRGQMKEILRNAYNQGSDQ